MKAVQPIPEGFHTITPYLVVHRAKQTIEFFKNAFGAQVLHISTMGDDGPVMNAEIKIGNSIVMLGERPPDQKSWPAMLYMYVEDCDETFKKAVQAGGKVIMEPADQFYGDRSGAIEDSGGNQWWIATRKENVSAEEMSKRISQAKKINEA